MLSTSKALFRNPSAGGGGTTDPSFAYVPLLLETTGTNGQQNNTFLDSSTNNFTITRNGTPTQGSITPYWPNGQWSNYFNGSSDWLSSTASTILQFGASAYTIEGWIYQTSRSGTPFICGGVFSGTGLQVAIDSSGFIYVSIPGVANLTAATTAIPLNTWTHFAIVRTSTSAGGFTYYINGVAAGTPTDANNYSGTSTTFNVATTNNSSLYVLTGYLSNFRIVKGVAVYTGAFAPPTNPLAATQSAGTNISAITGTQTSLLTCQSNRFIDRSAQVTPATFTVNGTPTVQAFQPFSPTASYSAATYAGSGYFNGTTDYLTAPASSALTLTADFTIEFWVYSGAFASGASNPSLFNTSPASIFYESSGSNRGLCFFVGSAIITTATTVLPNNQWNHVVCVRSGSTVSMFVNGSRVGTNASFSSTADFSSAFINRYFASAAGYFNGYMSNLRVVKGTAVYDPTLTTLTVPTTPLTAISGTSLLTCQSNRFKDNSSNAFAITVNGTPTVQAFQPFSPAASYSAATYAGSGYFGGSDYLNAGTNSAFIIGTGDFTIELWVYLISYGNTYTGFFTTRVGGQGMDIQILNSGATLMLGNSTGAIISANSVVPFNAWTHICAVRSGSSNSLYVNGTRVATGTDSTNFTDNGAKVATSGPSGVATPVAYISNVRFVKGTAVYSPASTTITVPTTPVTAITNTSLLLNMANAGIYDAAVQNVMTTVGDAQASTTQSKWSPTSMKYDGTGDWLTAVDGPQLQLGTGDFTIEGWVYLSAVGVVYGILSKGTATTGWSVNVTVLNKLQFSYTTSNLTGTTTLATGTWYYFAVVRSGIATGNLKLYLNGSVEATSGGAVTDNFNQTNTLYVGADRIGGSALNGYLQDIRITKGVGRTITTPTAAFPVQ